MANGGGRNRHHAAGWKCRAPYAWVCLIPRGPVRSFAHANSTQSCRPREALLSSGLLCQENGITILGGDGSIGFVGMKRARLGLAVVGMAASLAVGAALWPHASDAYAVLAAQDDPAVFSGIRIYSALRNNPDVIHENIEA